MNPTQKYELGLAALEPVVTMLTPIERAISDLEANLEQLHLCAAVNFARFEEIRRSDDLIIRKCSHLPEPIQLFLEPYSDEEIFVVQAVPISLQGKRETMLVCAGVTARFLWELGHRDIGVAVTDSMRRGHVFKHTSADDIVCREVTELRPTGGVS